MEENIWMRLRGWGEVNFTHPAPQQYTGRAEKYPHGKFNHSEKEARLNTRPTQEI